MAPSSVGISGAARRDSGWLLSNAAGPQLRSLGVLVCLVGFLQCVFKDCTRRISCCPPPELGIGRRKITLLVSEKC